MLFFFNILPIIKLFVSEYEEKLNDLCDKCKEMKQIYNKVLVSKSCIDINVRAANCS